MSTEKLKALASRTLGLWRVVKLFREVGHRGVPATVDHVRTQTVRILEELDPATKTLSEINQRGYVENILSDATASASIAAKSAIENTSLVLGHSICDEALTACCRISVLLKPDRWLGLVKDRKVTLAEALSTPAHEIADQLLLRYVDQLSREPLRDRVDRLNERYQPAPPFHYEGQPYRFDRDRLEQIDKHRQRVIHDLELVSGAHNRDAEDLLYLEATCFYFIWLVAHGHGIRCDPETDDIEALRNKAETPVQLAYEGLLLATSLPKPEEALWSAGGQIFVTADRRTRQIPLLMPAAMPDTSLDGRKLAFVRYRPRPEPANDERRRVYIGDIWVSAADGSGAEQVLEGGPRPGLAVPVDGLPKELEGIASPKFDSEARKVYFIADAWATSGAVYVLDLQTRDVNYVTSGNLLAVLHGEPHTGSLLVCQHRYHGPPQYGSDDHFYLVAPNGDTGDDLGPDFDAALARLYGVETWRAFRPNGSRDQPNN